MALCGDLAPLRAVKDNPHGEVLGKVLEMMLGSRGHEHKVAWLEWVPLAVVKQEASAANDDINLVLCVRGLLVWRHGERELYVKGAALQEADGVFARRTRDSRLSLGETNHLTAIWFAHQTIRYIRVLP